MLVVPLDGEDCPYAASERAPTSAIDSAASRSSRDPLPMSLTHLLMFAASLISLIISHTPHPVLIYTIPLRLDLCGSINFARVAVSLILIQAVDSSVLTWVAPAAGTKLFSMRSGNQRSEISRLR